jgi:hypothetical protein
VAPRRRTPRADGFLIEVTARSDDPALPLEVALRYEARGPVLTAEFEAVALADFDYCRLGFCLLLSEGDYRGRPAASRLEGIETGFRFPESIVTRDQHDPATLDFHRAFDRLDLSRASGMAIRLNTSGGAFEFEDQRNWTDPSFKAYSASAEPWPMRARNGEMFHQRVDVCVVPGVAPAVAHDRRISVGPVIGTVFPIDRFDGRLSSRSLRPGGGFQELNARRPDGMDADAIELAVNGAVHAADDLSVLETTTMHGAIVRAARSLFPGLPVLLAPVSFLDVAGDWRDAQGRYAPEPFIDDPDAAPSARQGTELGAAWVVASVANLTSDPPDAVRYFSSRLPADSVAARTVDRFRALRGRTLRGLTTPASVVGVAIEKPHRDGVTFVLALANLSTDPVEFLLPDGRRGWLDGLRSEWFEVPAESGADEQSAAAHISAQPPALANPERPTH